MIVRIVKVTYTLVKNQTNWTAQVAAPSVENAISYLGKELGAIKVITTEDKGSLNSIVPEVEDYIIKSVADRKKAEKDKELAEKETKNENVALKKELDDLKKNMDKLTKSLEAGKEETKPKKTYTSKSKIKMGDK